MRSPSASCSYWTKPPGRKHGRDAILALKGERSPAECDERIGIPGRGRISAALLRREEELRAVRLDDADQTARLHTELILPGPVDLPAGTERADGVTTDNRGAKPRLNSMSIRASRR